MHASVATDLPSNDRCPVCGESSATLLAEGHDFEYASLPDLFRVWQCSSCGHGRLDPVPAENQLAAIYPPTYYTINPDSPIHFDGFIYRTKLRRDVDRILSLTGGPGPRSVVDLGCGDAERLACLGQRLGGNVRLSGVDMQPDPSRQRELRERGVEIVNANIECGLDELEDGAYDLALMCQIIEHLYDPMSAVEAIAKKLAPGGRLLIETPNLGGLDFRVFKSRYWGGYHFPRHFHFFTTATLRRAVERAGLEVRTAGFIPSGFAIVSLRNRLGLSSVARSRRLGEFLNMRNLLIVAAVTALDLAWITLGRETSNQYVVAQRGGGPG